MGRNKKLNFIDVFSGAGGLSCGMEMAGMRCLLGVDHNKHAMATFALNHKEAKTHVGPIEELSSAKLKEMVGGETIHAVVGGPPCQGFSTVGPGDPNDIRNKLFLEFVRIVKITKPNFVVIENVTGLIAKKNEKTLKKIFREFEKLGLVLDVRVLSAHHYGVPEKRRRTIIIGTNIACERIPFPMPTHDVEVKGHYRPSTTVGDVLNDLKDSKGVIHNHDLDTSLPKSKLDLNRLKRIPEGRGIRYQKDELELLTPKLRLNINWEELPEKRFRQTKYQRLDRSKVGPTIMTHRHSYFHPTENRYLTAREAAKLQSFPNDFVFTGPISAQWRQIGNAVPPLLGKAIGVELIKLFNGKQNLSTNGKSKQKITKKKISSIRENAFSYNAKN